MLKLFNDWWSLKTIQRQKEWPNGRAVKEILLNANSSIVIQHNCETSRAVEQLNSIIGQLWNSTAEEQHGCEKALFQVDSSALLYLLWSSETSLMFQPWCFSSSQKNKVSTIWWKGSVLWATGELTYIERNPHLWSLIGPPSCKWGLQKVLSWLVRMEVFWLVSEDANVIWAAQLLLDGESLSPISWNTTPETQIRAGSVGKNTVQAGFSLKCDCVSLEAPV